MYRGLTLFHCTQCGNDFKSHDIEYCATALSVPQRCPKCGSVRTLPDFWIEAGGIESSIQLYTSIWEEIEQAEKKREERIQRAEAKRNADEKQQRKKREKKRKHMSQKQREAYDKKRKKKEAKRNRSNSTLINDLAQEMEEIILLGPTWFPPGTPLRIEE